MNFFDRYNIFARLLPVILISLPFFVLYYFCIRPATGDFVEYVIAIRWVPDVGFTLAVIYLLMQINRLISKEFFEKKIFSNGLYLPTTNYLMCSNPNLSFEYTRKVHFRIYKDFGIEIPSMQEELREEKHSRQKINEAVALIRRKVGNGVLVLQHNIEYGFIRNLVGGSIVSIIMSVINVTIFSWTTFNKTALIISCILVVFYLCLVIFNKWLIMTFGNNYASVLIQEYMAG